ncbi:DNA polymerase III subunit delta' [Actinomadura madurae]|uniref:DNA polymerase III subunit delta' n=1 Tax=Actinomadura madurae TaxID=1993 RepID=UPI00202762E7|nr:DNA polymerase III subunit delta' [Actinomadura madurae]MCP9952720.1 DNA polymerase III subunit delta' [Actinomadura madurae]MCP9969483.1 DNA polymerase III subunit delta' [Actinomadura madurae]MCQ0018174.1 DNA polymerase III subunit delta' [Actinomadura madurae]URM98220.1 DNA polymerase III subunit delta' [Actinomadura madurae]URN08911.1 DNA polymerase III subunit delta' [Actinomadura madurae]
MSVWDDLVGQEPVIAQLSAAAGGTGGVAHAWLFTGPPGSGRVAAARAFAAALQCTETPRGCGHCASCHQVLQGTHADVEVVRPEGLSFGVKDARSLVLRASSSPSGGRWQVVLFEDADRATEGAANALLKAIEEPPARTVWLLCTPSPEDLLVTIRSRCRLVTLQTPPIAAIADFLVQRDGVDRDTADVVARAAQGHISRARRLAADPAMRQVRDGVVAIPRRLTGVSPAVAAAETLVKAAEAERDAQTAELNETETSALRKALGESEKGRMPRGTAGALKDLEARQKSRATRVLRDALDRTLLDLASYYRDLLTLQLGAGGELVNIELGPELRTAAGNGRPEDTLRRLDAIMDCRERLAANVNPQLAFEALTLALRTG